MVFAPLLALLVVGAATLNRQHQPAAPQQPLAETPAQVGSADQPRGIPPAENLGEPARRAWGGRRAEKGDGGRRGEWPREGRGEGEEEGRGGRGKERDKEFEKEREKYRERAKEAEKRLRRIRELFKDNER